MSSRPIRPDIREKYRQSQFRSTLGRDQSSTHTLEQIHSNVSSVAGFISPKSLNLGRHRYLPMLEQKRANTILKYKNLDLPSPLGQRRKMKSVLATKIKEEP
jgi:hypothetical protein